MSDKKLNIFRYHDYRTFLADFFEFRRQQNSSFSIRSFAQNTGLQSHSYISAIVKGKRNLTDAYKQRLLNGLNLEQNERRYFLLLVDFNQSKSAIAKQKAFEQLNHARRHTPFYKLHKKQFEYLSKWYHQVVRELVTLISWNNNYAYLGSLLEPRITEAEARVSVALLLDLGVVAKREDGSYYQTDQRLTTIDIAGHLVRQIRKQFIELSLNANDTMNPTIRNLGSSTLTLSKEHFATASAILNDAREKINALSEMDNRPHRVYHATLHLFPLSAPMDR